MAAYGAQLLQMGTGRPHTRAIRWMVGSGSAGPVAIGLGHSFIDLTFGIERAAALIYQHATCEADEAICDRDERQDCASS
jgi:hypothetical protein